MLMPVISERNLLPVFACFSGNPEAIFHVHMFPAYNTFSR